MLTSVPTTAVAENEKLEMLSINIRHWRKDKGLPFRHMPVVLWDEAVVLARLLGVKRVACVLGLNLDDLKRRMEGRQGLGGHTTVMSQPAAKEADAQFIELPGIAVTPPAAPAPVEPVESARPDARRDSPADPPAVTVSGAQEAVVEVTAANGDRLTVRMPVGSFNIASLIQEFRSRS